MLYNNKQRKKDKVTFTWDVSNTDEVFSLHMQYGFTVPQTDIYTPRVVRLEKPIVLRQEK